MAGVFVQVGIVVSLAGTNSWQGATLRGEVYDSVSGDPLAGVVVAVPPAELMEITSEDGRFALGPIGAGVYQLHIEVHRYRARAFTLHIDSSLLRDHDIGRIALAPSDSMVIDVSGLVHESAGPNPIAGAAVSINERVVGLSNFDGAFATGVRLPRGLNRLHVRATGFDPVTADFWVDSASISFDVPLAQRSFRLADVVVEAEPARGKLDRFYRHRSGEMGRFLDSAAVETARRQYVTDILRAVPGVQVVPGVYTVRLSRAPATMACVVNQPQFFIDGHPLTLGRDISINELVDEGDILAVEVYNGPAVVPLEYKYGNADCGVVAIWTKVPARR